MNKQLTTIQGLLFFCSVFLSAFAHSLPSRRQSGFSDNNFDASLVTDSQYGSNNGAESMPRNNMDSGDSHTFGGPGRGSYGSQNSGQSQGRYSGGRGGSAGPFSGGASGGSAGPFTSGSSNNMAGPFTSSSSGNAAGPFSGSSNSNSAGPFSGGSAGNRGPFSGFSSKDAGKTPFNMAKGNAIDFSQLFPLDEKTSLGISSSSYDMKGGPGGLTGGLFDMGTNDGPGGLNGGPFLSRQEENAGPGTLSGGNFLANTDSQVDTKFDTSEYEQSLKELFATDSSSSNGDGNPFDPNSYNSDINNAGTGRTHLNSEGSRQYEQYQKTGNTYSSSDNDRRTSDPFSTRHFKDSASPFKVRQTYQGGSRATEYNRYRDSYGNTDSSYSTYRQGSSDLSSNSYLNPFNKDTDYNELLSTPFESNQNNNLLQRGQAYTDQSTGSQYSPFKADHGLSGMSGMSNPGGNPFSQAGSMVGRG